MGSRTFDGVRFSAFSEDHLPAHVHGRYAGVEVILELEDERVRLADRKDSIRPANAKRSSVNHILQTALLQADELMQLSRTARG